MLFRGSWLVALALCAACTTSSDDVSVSISVEASTTSLGDQIGEYDVFVLDGLIDCAGRLLSDRESLAMAVVEPNGEATLELSAGPRTFHAVGTEFGLPIAVGCQGTFLEAGTKRSVIVIVNRYGGDPPDGGPPIDAGPQPVIDAAIPVIDGAAPVIDAAVIDAAPMID
jgi:hypothetical protein